MLLDSQQEKEEKIKGELPVEVVKKVNAADAVVNVIKNEIQSGHLKVGDKLPTEINMAKELQVNRSTLREGLRILSTFGLIESRQGEGTFVVDNRAKNFFEFMGYTPGRENSAKFLELRRILEVGNIVAVCEDITEEDLNKLEEMADIFNHPHELEEYVEADIAFHSYLIDKTDNDMLSQINKMIATLRRDMLTRLFQTEEGRSGVYGAHEKIIQALRSKDKTKCMNAVSTHIDETVVWVDDLYGDSVPAKRQD